MSNQQLIDIIAESRAMLKEDKRKPIVECPNDGEPLAYNEKRRIWFCPLGDYQRR